MAQTVDRVRNYQLKGDNVTIDRAAVNVDLQDKYRALQSDLAAAEAETPVNERKVNWIKEKISDNGAQFIENNAGLVQKNLKTFSSNNTSAYAEDYKQDAIMGLLKARERWDPAGGAGFATFAANYIKGATVRSVRNNEFTHLSNADFTARSHVMRLTQELQEKLDRAPSNAEIIEEAKKQKVNLTAGLVKRAQSVRATSLDTPIGDEAGSTVGDLVAEKSAHKDDLDLDDASWWRVLSERTENLSAEELIVQIRRMGVAGDVQTFVEIGASLGQGRETIRRIEVRAGEKSGLNN